jgi:hypothetical protein
LLPLWFQPYAKNIVAKCPTLKTKILGPVPRGKGNATLIGEISFDVA